MKQFTCFLLLFLFVNITGCRVEHFLITGIKFSGIESDVLYGKNKNDRLEGYICTTEFKDQILFVVSYERELQYVAGNISNGIGSKCYATSLGTAYDNSLLEQTFSICFNKPFDYAGQTYNADTNILDFPEILDEIKFIYDFNQGICCGGTDIIIEFSDTFAQNASFSEDSYAVTFSCETSDKKFLQAETTVKFSLNK